MSDTFRFPTAEEITRDWGERCPSLDQDCGRCQMWATYDMITALQADNALLVEERGRLRKALEPFALISMEGLTEDDVYTTITTCSEYFHTAAKAYREPKP